MRHDYVYYPERWTDDETKKTYQRGYYDEEGKYYRELSQTKNGTCSNLIYVCPYCGKEKIVLSAAYKDVIETTVTCQSCGGNMELQTALDTDVVRMSEEESSLYTRESDGKTSRELPPVEYKQDSTKVLKLVILAFAILVTFFSIKNAKLIKEKLANTPIQITQQQGHTQPLFKSDTDIDLFGEELFLDKVDDSTWKFTDKYSVNYDKKITWDEEAESYYDPETDCWIWYNTQVSPRVWQYWYEGISSDYGDYGWMEYDTEEGRWYIEESEGRWITMPNRYDATRLWHVDNSLR